MKGRSPKCGVRGHGSRLTGLGPGSPSLLAELWLLYIGGGGSLLEGWATVSRPLPALAAHSLRPIQCLDRNLRFLQEPHISTLRSPKGDHSWVGGRQYTYSCSTWATGHLYWAVLKRQMSAYCRTAWQEGGRGQSWEAPPHLTAHFS